MKKEEKSCIFERVLAEKFSTYSKYVILQRALPDIRDGLKPVQRRIIYSMFDLKVLFENNYKKSARIVGDVIGRFHPHGDVSIYEALVRMSQSWKTNYPLILMQGNNGSIDGDSAAAMRYTECKLEKISNYFLSDIEKSTINFSSNFDDSEKEPDVLPSLFPNLIVNGSSGIAAGYLTDIPPHNLNEIIDATILKIMDPKASIEKILAIVKGPDFPTGGNVYEIDKISDILKTGEGKINVVCRYEFDYKLKKIRILEIPFSVSKQKIVSQIQEIILENKIEGIVDVLDNSNSEKLEILVEIKPKVNHLLVMEYLLKKTDLQISYFYKMIAIVENRPVVFNIENYLESYIKFLKLIKTRSLSFDLKKCLEKLEITEGIIKAIEITDQIIKVIKNSDNSKKGVIKNLENFFSFTKIQAEAIAEIKLYRLSKLDKQNFLQNKQKLILKKEEISKILNDEKKLNSFLINLLLEIKTNFGLVRKTNIFYNKREVEKKTLEQSLIKKEKINFLIFENGLVKKISKNNLNVGEILSKNLEVSSYPLNYLETSNFKKILFITEKGNFGLVTNQFLLDFFKNKSSSLNLLVDNFSVGEKIIFVEVLDEEKILNKFLLMISEQGKIKIVKLKDFCYKKNKFNVAFFLENGDTLKYLEILEDYEKDKVLIVTKNNNYLKFNTKAVKVSKVKSKGIKAGKFLGKDLVVACTKISSLSEYQTIFFDDNQCKKVFLQLLPDVLKNEKPKKFLKSFIFGNFLVKNIFDYKKNEKIFYINNKKNLFFFDGKNIPITDLEDNPSFFHEKNKVIKIFRI